eukprot:7086014-Ditylum_brightwellii.AAC.1
MDVNKPPAMTKQKVTANKIQRPRICLHDHKDLNSLCSKEESFYFQEGKCMHNAKCLECKYLLMPDT